MGRDRTVPVTMRQRRSLRFKNTAVIISTTAAVISAVAALLAVYISKPKLFEYYLDGGLSETSQFFGEDNRDV
jgi:hypothetical protein